MQKTFTVLCCLAIVMFFWAQPAWANAGLPMIFLGLPFLIAALIPVAVIEGLVYHRELSCSLKRSLAGSSAANIVSTLIGYPLAWTLQVAVMMAVGGIMFLFFRDSNPPDFLEYIFFPLSSAWLMPGAMTWQIFLAGLIGLVPAFFVSFWCEWRLLKRLWKDIDPQLIRRAVWKANTTTYLILGGLLAALTLFQWLLHLNAFDFLRSRADEQVTFQRPLTGEIIVLASTDSFVVDPATAEKKGILPSEVSNTKRGLNASAMTAEGIWFKDHDSDKSLTKLYYMARPLTEPKFIGAFRSILHMSSLGADVIIQGQSLNAPKSFYHSDGVYLVTATGKVSALYTGDVEKQFPNMIFSPVESKAVYLKFAGSQPLDKAGHFYLVTAEIRIFDFATGEDKKLAECSGVSRSPEGTYNLTELTWAPDGRKLYFSTLSGEAISSVLPSINIQELIRQYRLESYSYAVKDGIAFLRDLGSKLGVHILGVDVSSGHLEEIGSGSGVQAVSYDGNRMLIESNAKEQDYFVIDRAAERMVRVEPFNLDHGFKEVDFSPDGGFLVYSGTSRDFLDQHYLSDDVRWWNQRPSWLWVKDIETGVEKRLGLRPVMGLNQFKWAAKE